MTTTAVLEPRSKLQWIGLFAGPALALLCLALLPRDYAGPSGETVVFARAGRVTLALMAWMGTWWLSEAIEISATSLLPVAVLPLLGASTVRDAAAPYAHPLIFLFIGGFLLALSMQRWGLDRRLALATLRLFGTRPRQLVGGFMLATAALSACVSNTATTAMMLPIALSILELTRDDADDRGRSNLALALMLGIAYAASIGGVATIIGSPTNGILVGYVSETMGREISFLRWMSIGLPLSAVFLPICWWLLTRWLFRLPEEPVRGGREALRREQQRLGPLGRGEWVTLVVFALCAIGWITRPLLQRYVPELSDAGIAIVAGLVLFVIPVDARRGEFAMDWPTAQRLPWGLLLLFGGGLSLASAVDSTGVAQFLAAHATAFADVPAWLTVLVVTAFVVFLTELTSNTATAATLLPVLAAVAPSLGLHPFRLIVPATLAASCAFMMPVATPPNAIVFSSGRVTIPQMCRAGLWLNVTAIVLIGLLAWLLLPLTLPME